MDRKEQYLEKQGFIKEYYNDESGYWVVKKFKLGEFNGRFYYDGRFCQMELECFIGGNYKSPLFETIWNGSWRQFKEKIKKYG